MNGGHARINGPSLYENIVAAIKRIPRGKVATYGQVALLAGNPRAARQVARALHASSATRGLPWHRVINSRGTVSLPRGAGFEHQLALLRAEGVRASDDGRVDLARFGWRPRGYVSP